MNQNRENIIVQIKQGNLRAFKNFYDDFFPVLNTFAIKYLSKGSESEDVVQESFLYFWNKRKNFNSIDSVKSYLYKTVRSRCLNLLRDSSNKKNIDIETLKDNLFFKESIIEIETYDLLYKAIKKLSPQEQTVIEMSIDGMKNEQIAKDLNVSINTIKTVKKRSYNKLRIDLKDNLEVLLLLFYIQNLFR